MVQAIVGRSAKALKRLYAVTATYADGWHVERQLVAAWTLDHATAIAREKWPNANSVTVEPNADPAYHGTDTH